MPRDIAEFSEYVTLRWPVMLRTARLLTGEHALAEGLVQTALEKCFAAWPRLRAYDAADAYVRRTIVNTYLTWRQKKSWSEVTRDRFDDGVTTDTTDVVSQRSVLLDALAELPARQRAAVVLRFYEDLSVQQTAGLLGCSPGTVKSQTSKALAKLRDLLGDDLDEAEPQTDRRSRR
jgi:RNA polymerase sigma-70 factor (sigma-E family)